jgi:hypothetical protein
MTPSPWSPPGPTDGPRGSRRWRSTGCGPACGFTTCRPPSSQQWWPAASTLRGWTVGRSRMPWPTRALLPTSSTPTSPAVLPRTSPPVLEAQVDLADCMALGDGKLLFVMLGIAGGYRLSVGIEKGANLRLGWCLEGLGASGSERWRLGPITHLRACVGGQATNLVRRVAPVGCFYPCSDFFGKPWGKVVCDGSPHFPQGRMPISVTIQFPTDKHLQEVMEELL